ncbi:hypothetical protein PYK79_11115 [Streptomyces sp. ID05-04B]|uniref:hypothetical protein n=1 Tax=unclassified Streptomyces TaxID=2593676 RepID=UPI000D19EBE9|nr:MULTISPECIES: hypothetical protein [unclassified Streptomyces]AVV46477.1 hypothetical protein C6376_39075 [Streptomyces sp. P3]AVV46838.1 hypothetical protein C6376_41480 [Streptomyces sp. P3]MDX5563804.1 hypothetical protein [Streptomyces sp. ID05-04B]
MARWSLQYYLGTPHRPRDVDAELDDLLGEGIAAAHEYVRRVSGGAGTLREAVLLVDDEPGEDPLEGGPTIPLWITYVPYRPDADPDAGEAEPPRREVFHLPARLFETRVNAQGVASYGSPALGYLQLAVRRRLDDGREGTIRSVDLKATAD